ncbi:MAG: helix-turn-helix domain-containing protein [bacterium]
MREIAEILKVNRVTVQRWCKTAEIPAVKIGKSYRIEKKEFENWYRAKKGEAKSAFQEELSF